MAQCYDKVEHKGSCWKTSLQKKCYGDVDYSRNMNENLITLSFFALSQSLFGIARGL